MTWDPNNEQGCEHRKIRWEIVPWTRGTVLDLGQGVEKCFPHFVGIDSGHHEMFGHKIHPDIKRDARDLSIFATGSIDGCFSSHLLEHFEYSEVPSIFKEWLRVLKVGGFLTLYLPDKALYPNVGEPGSNPDHKWDPDYDSVVAALQDIDGWDMCDYQLRDQDEEYSGLYVLKRTNSGKHLSWRKPKPKKTACVARYGAIGDLVQATSVFAGLKRQGYHVTVMCTPPTSDILRNNPNIDEYIQQEKEQVPNGALGEYWDYWKRKFDKFVNLSETIEGTFLAMPGRTQHKWPPALRHSMMNRNYLEFQHELAGVPHRPDVRFFPTESEKDWAAKERKKMGGESIVMWQLAGSSRMHKAYPYLDPIVARLMISYPEVRVVLTGGPECVSLEEGWQSEPKVFCTAGNWSIRQTLAFLDQVDVLVGAETGVMNAGCCMDMPKIVFLSHSTHENLTRDWVNTIALAAPDVTCPGRGNNEAPSCHQLHYNWQHCKRDEATGVSVCMAQIHPALTWDCLQKAILTGRAEAPELETMRIVEVA